MEGYKKRGEIWVGRNYLVTRKGGNLGASGFAGDAQLCNFRGERESSVY